MKVLVTLNGLDISGTPLNAVDFARQASLHGVKSLLVGYRETIPTSGPSIVDVAAERGVELVVLNKGGSVARSVRDLDRVARRYGADLVHAYSGWHLRRPFWGPCRFGRLPLVMTVYEMSVPDHVYRRPALVVGTRYQEEEQRVVRPGSVHLISPPVDLSSDSPSVDPARLLSLAGPQQDALRLVIVSRLEDFKTQSITHAMRSMALLDRPHVELLIVGGGSDEAQLRAIGDEVNEVLGRRAIVFAGVLADPRVAYASADIVLGMGGSAARALAFGKPLIVTGEFSWFRTFSPDTAKQLFRNSFWSDEVEDDPVGALVVCLRALIDDSTWRRELQGFGRHFAEQNFGLEGMTERLVAVYQQALSEHRRIQWFPDMLMEMKDSRG